MTNNDAFPPWRTRTCVRRVEHGVTAITYGVTAGRVLKKSMARLRTRRFFQNTFAVAIVSGLAFYDRVGHTSRRVLRFKSRRTYVVVFFSWEHVSVHSLYLDSVLVFCSNFYSARDLISHYIIIFNNTLIILSYNYSQFYNKKV